MRTLQDEIKRTSLLINDNEQQPESLTRYDIEELMGVRRPRYARRKGVIKQK